MRTLQPRLHYGERRGKLLFGPDPAGPGPVEDFDTDYLLSFEVPPGVWKEHASPKKPFRASRLRIEGGEGVELTSLTIGHVEQLAVGSIPSQFFSGVLGLHGIVLPAASVDQPVTLTFRNLTDKPKQMQAWLEGMFIE